MAYQTILWQVDGGIARMTLNRPEVLNACNDTMLNELADALKNAEREALIRCVVLTGAGRGFCAGQDLAAMKGAADKGMVSFAAHLRTTYNPIIRRMRTMEKPIIGAINGVAAGAGASLALACDLRIASQTASFVEAFSKIGLIPDSGATWLLPRLVGSAKAFELMATGDKLTADEALRLGVVNQVVPAEGLVDATQALASRLATMPTRALGLTKRAINYAMSTDLDHALEYEAMIQEIAGRSEDFREGVIAFLEKRTPKFSGR